MLTIPSASSIKKSKKKKKSQDERIAKKEKQVSLG